MTDNKQHTERQPNKDESAAGDSTLQGRVDNSGNEQFKDEEGQADISHVDQQEGTMNNGELGGNLNKEDA